MSRCSCGRREKDHAPYPHVRYEGNRRVSLCESCDAEWDGVICPECQRLREVIGWGEFVRRKTERCGCFWCCHR